MSEELYVKKESHFGNLLYLCTQKRASLLTLGHSSQLDGPHSTADLHRQFKTTKKMEARTMIYPQEGQLLVSISDMSMMKDIKKAISMLKGVTKVKFQKPKAASKREQSQTMEQREQKQTCLHSAESRQSSRNSNCLSAAEREQARPEGKTRLYDPETGEYLNDETIKVIEDAHKGIGVTHYDSLQDFYKEMGL